MEGREVELIDYLQIIWKRRYFIALATLVCAGTAAGVSLFLPKTYEASASLVIMPSRFSSELKPRTLSVQTYQKLVESDYILNRVKLKAVNQGLLADEEVLRIDRNVFTEIFKSKGAGGRVEFEPMIKLTVNADDPEKVKQLADLWAITAISENATLLDRSKSGTVEFIEGQFPQAVSSLLALEDTLRDKQDHYGQTIFKLKNESEQQITRFKTKTDQMLLTHDEKCSKLLTDYDKETERLTTELVEEKERVRLEFINREKPELSKKELEITRNKLNSLKAELIDVDLSIKSKQDELAQIKAEITSQPHYLVLSKAVTDDALWEKMDGKPGKLPEELKHVKLTSEQLNPTYQALVNRKSNVEIDINTLGPRREHLLKEMGRLKGEIDEIQTEVTRKDLDLLTLLEQMKLKQRVLKKERESSRWILQEQRKIARISLADKRQTAFDALKREKAESLAVLEREGKLEIKRLSREAKQAGATYTRLAQKTEEAKLARAEQEQDVKVGALAVKPIFPSRPRIIFNILLAAIAGLAVVIIFVVLQCYVTSNREVLSGEDVSESQVVKAEATRVRQVRS